MRQPLSKHLRSMARPAGIGLAGALFAAIVSSPAVAQVRYSEMPAARAYQSCMALARAKPSEGFEAAIAWRDEGGAAAARHCTAIALVGMGQLGGMTKPYVIRLPHKMAQRR